MTLLLVAGLVPVWFCVQTVFHPQDLFALGLALGALACGRRDRWVAAGVLLGLAILSQQSPCWSPYLSSWWRPPPNCG